MKKSIEIDKDRRERTPHGSPDFPLKLTEEHLAYYEGFQFAGHWHPELEWLYVHEGGLRCRVNEQEIDLGPGEAVFINANALHTGWSPEGGDCRYIGMTLHPDLLGAVGSRVRRAYVDPVLACGSLPAFRLAPGDAVRAKALALLPEIECIYKEGGSGWELAVAARLLQLWRHLYALVQAEVEGGGAAPEGVEKLKRILAYMHGNYAAPLTLAQIAAQANISPSELSHSFKRYMRQSPMQYLLRYRVRQSLAVLARPEATVTEAALAAGFGGASYYSEVFRRLMGQSPSEWRRDELDQCKGQQEAAV